MKDLLWLIPVIPLLGAMVNGLVGNRRGWSKHATTIVGMLGSGLAMLAAFGAIADWWLSVGMHGVHVLRLFTWIPAGLGLTTDGLLANLQVDFALRIDSLSAVMLFFVTFVGFLIHLYSVGYMHGESDRAYSRYFAYLNLFMFAMLTLVLGANLLVLFVGWEGVGLCSYLLIGFYFEKDWCAAAGKKAFIVNRIGDFGFLLAIFLVVKVFGTVDFAAMQGAITADPARYVAYATPIALLLFVGAVGKSAQLPLYVWLPDAMAGPTPVSALIHAATMVTAGVYMVVRTNFIYALAPKAMLVVAIIGGLTAVFAATIGLAQNDIKKVLAYSTVSQLGYMFLGAGVGAFAAAIFHVFTHAFFKACLFLGSGSVIHAMGGEQDMRKMGGLKKVMPKTYWTFLAATLAIAGIVPFAGFFSKDAILEKTFEAGHGDLHHFGNVHYVLWFLAVAGALLTALYMFRAVYMTFHGSFRGTEEQKHHLHESPWTMTLPLVVLGVGSVVVGFLGFPKEEWNFFDHFLSSVVVRVGVDTHAAAAAEHVALGFGTEMLLMVISLGVALTGVFLAWKFYLGKRAFEIPHTLAERFPFGYRVLLNKYYVDELYNATAVAGTMKLARASWDFDARVVDGAVNGSRHVTVGASFLSGLFDLNVVDGLVNLVAKVYDAGSRGLRRLQRGVVQGYALIMAVGFLLMVAAALLLSRAF